MIFAVLDNDEADLINETALVIIQPVYAIVFSTLTIAACLIIGLPIRLSPRLFEWWTSKPLIAFAGIIAGLFLLTISLNSHFTNTANTIINGEQTTKQIPNISLSLSGWFLSAFFVLHFYPCTIIKKIKRKISSKQIDKYGYSAF